MKYQTVNPALEKVIVADTKISDVRGETGELVYRGYDIAEVVNWPFAKVAWLLLYDEIPTASQEAQFENFLLNHGQLETAELALLKHLPRQLHPMLMLQSMIPSLSGVEKAPLDAPIQNSELARGIRIAAKIPALLSNWYHLQEHNTTVNYPHHCNYHENFLLQWLDAAPTKEQTAVLNTTQILQMEHGLNASAFSARVTASTEAPIESVLVSGIGTLFGRLHGGADQAALEMALNIGHPDKVESVILNMLANKEKVMGMGHREYRRLDPRAKVLKPLAHSVCESTGNEIVYATLARIEAVCQNHFANNNKEIWANVEFYKGAVFMALDIPPRFFTALFAMARVFGYLAHYAEFKENPRVIRPHARYVGRQAQVG